MEPYWARGESAPVLVVCGADPTFLGGLNAFYLLVDKPETYGLPSNPRLPTRNLAFSALWSTLGAVVLGLFGFFSLRTRGDVVGPDETSGDTSGEGTHHV